jgi:hypothetical protein
MPSSCSTGCRAPTSTRCRSSTPRKKQALADLLARLETDTDVPYGVNGTGLTQTEIDEARTAVARDMGW